MPPSRFASREMYSRLPNMHGQEHISLFSSLCETRRWCHYDTVQDQVYLSVIEFRPNNPQNYLKCWTTFGIFSLTLKGAGRQTVDTRSTFGIPL